MYIRDFFERFSFIKWILLVVGTVTALVFACMANLKTVVVTEAGEPFDVTSVWTTKVKLPVQAEHIVNTDEVGTQKCNIRIFGMVDTEIVVEVRDTTMPEVELQKVYIYYGDTCVPEDFIASYDDVSPVSYSFVREPDTSVIGTQNVIIHAVDSWGNGTLVTGTVEIQAVRSVLEIGIGDAIPDASEFVFDDAYTAEYVSQPESTISEYPGDYEVKVKVNGKEEILTLRVVDNVPPNISTSYIKTTVNTNISYKKNINISDNVDKVEDLEMEIDNTGVDLSNIGCYTITCTVTDTAGNSTVKEITVEVVETGTEVHTQEEINAYADEILAGIIDDSMSIRDKAYAIYRFTRTNIAYVSEAQQSDWLRGAYEGMVLRTGNCFTYAATAKALLERIGLEPLTISKEKESWTSQSNHHWLLLDLGEGYYHYDPTPRADGTWFFMWTDSELLEYSNAHMGSHNFTRSKYPEIK